MQIPAAETSSQSRTNSGFLAWWNRELRGIFVPPAPIDFKHPKRRLIVAAGTERVRWLEETDQSLKPVGPETDTTEAPPEALRVLKRLSSRRRPVPIGLRFEKAMCFERRTELPEAARNDFARILNLDLERATPFKRGGVYTAICEDRALPAERGKVALRQFVVKREIVDEPLRQLNAQGLDVSFADCWDQEGSKPLAINFLAEPESLEPHAAPPRTLTKLLGLLALILTASAAWLSVERGNTALAALDAQIASAKARAQSVRKSVDTAEAAYTSAAAIQDLKSRRVPAAAILEEVSRLLPDTAYASDIRIEKDKVSVTGLASSAAALVPVIERSELLKGAALTAPVLLDTSTNKEQFKLEASVVQSEQAQTTGGKTHE